MSTIWFVTNPQSGSFDADLLDLIVTRLAESGHPVARIVKIGDDELPNAAAVRGVTRIIVMTGDGTVSALHESLKGWDGELLVLPGGTMNLLERALHGEVETQEIITALIEDRLTPVQVPIIVAPGLTALSGIFAGPTTAWGDVREQMRNLDVAGLAETVPKAIAATLGEESVSADSVEGSFPAFYLQPASGGIRLIGVRADGPGDLLAHGWAWLSGDFRDGPSDHLGTLPEVTIHGSEAGGNLSLLVDGEKSETADPAQFRAAHSDIRFLSLNGACSWP